MTARLLACATPSVSMASSFFASPPPARRLHYGINQFGSGPGFFHGFNIDKGIFSIAAKLTQAGYHGRDR